MCYQKDLFIWYLFSLYCRSYHFFMSFKEAGVNLGFEFHDFACFEYCPQLVALSFAEREAELDFWKLFSSWPYCLVSMCIRYVQTFAHVRHLVSDCVCDDAYRSVFVDCLFMDQFGSACCENKFAFDIFAFIILRCSSSAYIN